MWKYNLLEISTLKENKEHPETPWLVKVRVLTNYTAVISIYPGGNYHQILNWGEIKISPKDDVSAMEFGPIFEAKIPVPYLGYRHVGADDRIFTDEEIISMLQARTDVLFDIVKDWL